MIPMLNARRMVSTSILFALLTFTLQCQGASGALGESPPARLEARSGHAMTYDASRRRVLLFGGAGATMRGDLWSWDGSAWTQLSSEGADTPPPREDAVFVFDEARGRAVLFGGRNGRTQLSDTWEWDGARWARHDVAGPGARLHAVGAFDANSARVRVFGGLSDADVPLRDSWEWDGVRWNRAAIDVPVRQPASAMAFDVVTRTTVLLLANLDAPERGALYRTSLLAWTGGGWRGVPGDGPAISPMQPLVGAGAKGVLLVDGGAAQGEFTTSRHDGTGWTTVARVGPSPRNGHAIAYDAARDRVVLFGGFRGSENFSDTWEWDGTRWSSR